MTANFDLAGSLADWDVPSVLCRMHLDGIDGQLRVTGDGWEKTVLVEEQRVRFASSTSDSDMLGRYLIRRGVIDEATLRRSTDYMRAHRLKHGRALLEMGIIGNEHLWEHMLGHLRDIVFSLFCETRGRYAIRPLDGPVNENIALNNDIPGLVLDGVRQIRDEAFIESRFAAVTELFPQRAGKHVAIRFKPYELHVLELVRRHRRLADVIARSELLRFDTLKTLHALRLLGLVAESEESAAATGAKPAAAVRRSFPSCQEALSYYNAKYAHIYRTLSKQIGPVALSILSDSIDAIRDTLPPCFANLQLAPDGAIEDGPLLKALWFRSLDETLPDLLRGLEEILYAEVYAVRKHLGRGGEQAILQWIRESGE